MLVRRLRRRRQPEGGLPVDALPTCRIGDHIDCRNDRRVRGPCIDSLPVEPAGRGPNRRKLRSKDGVRCGLRQLGINRLVTNGIHEHPRVVMTNSVCNSGRDSTRPPGPATDRYGDPHTSRFVRPLAGCATLISIDELVIVAQNVRAGAAAASVVGFRSWPRRTAERGLGSLSRFGDGVDQSAVAALVAGGMRRAGSTERPAETGNEPETTLGSPAKGRQSPAAAGITQGTLEAHTTAVLLRRTAVSNWRTTTWRLSGSRYQPPITYRCGTRRRTAKAAILWGRMWGDSARLVAGSTRAARVHIVSPGLHEMDAGVEQRTIAEVSPHGRRPSMSKRSLRGLTGRLRNL